MKLLRKFRIFAIQKPYQAILAVLGLFGVAFTMFRIVIEINQRLGLGAAVLFFSLILGIIIYVIMTYMEYDILNSYKIQSDQGYIYNKVDQQWHILKNGQRQISCVKEFLFFKKPEPDDCVDILFGSLTLDVDQLQYKSLDSTMDHCILSRTDAINVYWKPKGGPIEIGDIYTHDFSYLYPSGTDPLEKSITVASRVYVKKMTFRITTENPIISATINKNDENIAFWDSKSIFDTSKNIHPSFVKKFEPNIMEIEFEKLEPSESYFIVLRLAGINL